MDLRTNSNYLPIQHQMTVCIIGTEYVHCPVQFILIFVLKGMNAYSLRGLSDITAEPKQQNQSQDTVPISTYFTATSPVHISYYIPISVTSQVLKQFPCACYEGTRGSEGRAPLILNLRWVVSFTLLPLPFDRRLNDPTACLGVLEKPEIPWLCRQQNHNRPARSLVTIASTAITFILFRCSSDM
jgi:hypothetical protein